MSCSDCKSKSWVPCSNNGVKYPMPMPAGRGFYSSAQAAMARPAMASCADLNGVAGNGCGSCVSAARNGLVENYLPSYMPCCRATPYNNLNQTWAVQAKYNL